MEPPQDVRGQISAREREQIVEGRTGRLDMDLDLDLDMDRPLAVKRGQLGILK